MRIGFHFETPTLVLGQMPMERVHLEAGKQFDLLFQLFKRDETAADVVHQTAQFERGPVGDGHTFELGRSVVAFSHLRQCLNGAKHARFRHGVDGDAARRNDESIGFVWKIGQLMVERTSDAPSDIHRDSHC